MTGRALGLFVILALGMLIGALALDTYWQKTGYPSCEEQVDG